MVSTKRLELCIECHANRNQRKCEQFLFQSTYVEDAFYASSTYGFDVSILTAYVTVGDALSGLGEPRSKIKGTPFQDNDDSHVDVTPPRDRERISYVPEGSYLAAQTHVSIEIRGNLKPKDTTKYLRLNRKKPSNTLRCGEIFFHPTENRYLTPREYMRIHGYKVGVLDNLFVANFPILQLISKFRVSLNLEWKTNHRYCCNSSTISNTLVAGKR